MDRFFKKILKAKKEAKNLADKLFGALTAEDNAEIEAVNAVFEDGHNVPEELLRKNVTI